MSGAPLVFNDHLAEILLALKRYVARHGHRMVQADGTLNDLFVSIAEARALLGDLPLSAPPSDRAPLPEAAGRIAEALAAHRQDLAVRAPAPSLAALRDAFRLDDTQLRLLVAAAAPLVSVDVARLYAFAWADFAVKQPTVGFLAELLADEPSLVPRLVAELSDEAPLVRHRLIVRQDSPSWGRPSPLLHQLVTVPERIVAFLLDRPASLPRSIADAAELHAPAPVEGLLVTDAVARAIDGGIERASTDPGGRPRLLLVGARGSGRRSALRGRLAARGQPLLTLDLQRLPAERDAFEEALLEASREARLYGALLLLRGDEVFDDPKRLAAIDRPLARVLARHEGQVALTALRPVAPLHHLVDGLLEVVFPAPTAAQQRRLWREALDAAGCAVEEGIEDHLADRFNLPPGAIHTAVADARARAAVLAADPNAFELSAEDVIHAVRRRANHALGEIAEPFATALTWDDVVLPQELIDSLTEILNHARLRQHVFDEWGFRRLVSYGRGLSCLFAGPPGTGKTMVAAILADSLGRELYRIDLSRVSSKWVGETEKNLSRVFDEAERAQVILLFDEADSLFAKRTEVRSANDRFANQEINYLLQRMESYDGMTILTTNFEKSIDEAFKRRIRFRLSFPMPDAEHRTLLWRSMIPREAAAMDDLRFDDLGQQFELAGGSIKNAVLRAAFYAAEEGAPITHEHLRRAAVAESEEMGRLINAS